MFQNWSDQGFVGCLFDLFVSDFYVSPNVTQGSICLVVGDVKNVRSPFQVISDGDAQVFHLGLFL